MKFASWLLGMVKTGGKWDFKRSWRAVKDQKVLGCAGTYVSVDDFGNMHFGYVLSALGSPAGVSTSGATAYGWLKNPTLRQWAAETHNNAYISWGARLHSRYGVAGGSVYYVRGRNGQKWSE